jgi:hypothetical protein
MTRRAAAYDRIAQARRHLVATIRAARTQPRRQRRAIAYRAQYAVAVTVGEANATAAMSSRQVAPIHQDDRAAEGQRKRRSSMTTNANENRSEPQELSTEELEQEGTTELPEREAMSLVNLNLAAPINAAVAANVLSDGSIAYADAVQDTPIDQNTG